MKRTVFGVGLGLVAAVALMACGSSPPSEPDPLPMHMPGNEPPVQCGTGLPCDCMNGLRGITTCEDNVASCDCSACEVDDPNPPPSDFDACGGEPFGAWRLLDTVYYDQTLTFATGVGSKKRSVECLAHPVAQAPALELLLELSDGGVARAVAAGGNVEYRTPESCLMGGLQETCEQNGCEQGACGQCFCLGGTLNLNVPSGSWTRNNAKLSVGSSDQQTAFDYCVQDDRMTLRLEGQQIVLELERVSLLGAPRTCGERSPEECAPAGVLRTDCHIGSCTGGEECPFAMAESDCTNRQGCTWDTSICSGTAAPTCAISDYDVLPGCQVTTQKPSCTGTSTACAEYTAATCPVAEGCKIADICTGESGACSGFWDACTPGCTCMAVPDGDYCECVGTSDCSQATTQAGCEADTLECHWGPGCSGSLPDCSQVSVETCEAVPGCVLAIP